MADGAAWPCGRGARRPPTGTAVSPHEEAESARVLCDNDSEPRGFPCRDLSSVSVAAISIQNGFRKPITIKFDDYKLENEFLKIAVSETSPQSSPEA